MLEMRRSIILYIEGRTRILDVAGPSTSVAFPKRGQFRLPHFAYAFRMMQ